MYDSDDSDDDFDNAIMFQVFIEENSRETDCKDCIKLFDSK